MSTQEKSFDFSQSRSQILTVQSVRIFFLTVVFLAFLAYQLVNTHFIAQGVFFSVYGLLTFSFLLNFIYILLFQEKNSWIGFFTALLFVWEVFFVTLLIYFIGVNQSLLIFLYLINIILCGIVFKRRGGVYLALVTSICFSFLLASDPQWQGNTLYMATGINNLAFFAVAYLSGYLSEQLNVMGLELLERGRDIRALKNLNSLIIEGMPSGQMTIDSKGIILQANEQAQKIFGKTAATILNQNIQTLIPPFQDFISRITSGPSAEIHTQDDRILRLSFSPLSDDQGVRLGSILLIDDITSFKKLETRVMQSEKLAAVGQLAAGIAHEIRNPLAGISGSVQLLQSEASMNQDQKKLMSIAIKEIDRLNHLITEFLDYARPVGAELTKINFSILLEETLDSLRNDPIAKHIAIEKNLDPGLHILGHGDKLKQALLNILVNAIQSMESTTKKTLTVRLFQHDSSVTLVIQDTGVGISEKNIKKIFEPFHTTKVKGTGLGLAIVHSILEAHSAQIDVKSVVSEGTTFSLTFERVLPS